MKKVLITTALLALAGVATAQSKSAADGIADGRGIAAALILSA